MYDKCYDNINPYHPETNAIEEFFSQLKHYIKKGSPNIYEDIEKSNKIYNNNQNKVRTFNKLPKHSFKIYKNK